MTKAIVLNSGSKVLFVEMLIHYLTGLNYFKSIQLINYDESSISVQIEEEHTLYFLFWDSNFDSVKNAFLTESKNIFIIFPKDIPINIVITLAKEYKALNLIGSNINLKTLFFMIENAQAMSETRISTDLQARMIDSFLYNSKKTLMGTELPFSKSELEIFKCSKEGLSLAETAIKLKLSKNTVAAYRSKMLSKTGLKSMNEMMAKINL